MKNGWDTDYLGIYEFKENYVSAQGYKVNLIEDTTGEDNVENYVSEKCEVFAANGIQYTLRKDNLWKYEEYCWYNEMILQVKMIVFLRNYKMCVSYNWIKREKYFVQ